VLVWSLIQTVVALIFALSESKGITTMQTVLFIFQVLLLFSGICFNYMSFKYEDYSKVYGTLLLVNCYLLLRILSIKLYEDSETSMSPEFMNVSLVISSNFTVITTIFINSIFEKHRLLIVAVQIVALHALILIHQFGFGGISSDINQTGFDAQGVAMLLLIVLLVTFLVIFLESKFKIEDKAR
jgi:hypothetical protein